MLRVPADAVPPGPDPFDGAPLVLLEGAVDDASVSRLEGVPAVLIGLDVPADDRDAVERVAAAVDAHPEAAVALSVLLRAGRRRSIGAGLVAESATYSLLQAGPDHRGWLDARTPKPALADEGPPVELDRHGDVLSITLARAAVHNAYNAAMRDALVDALAVAAADPIVRVELRGDGPSFCSGGDLTEFGTGPDPASAHVVRLRRSAGRALADVADRATVFLHGASIGAGIELAAFAGRVVAAPDTRVWLPELAMGLIPGAGGTVSLPRRIGRQRTALLALTGAPIDAATALEWGLVDEVRPGGGPSDSPGTTP